MSSDKKIPLYGFNNLTKSLSFSLYKVHYLATSRSTDSYHSYINKAYSSVKLTELLTQICHAIGGNVLNIASQDYTPQGASVTLMISEEAKPESLVAHLDKSHLCIHTYPEETPRDGIAIFRADIELSTCGIISPLKVLDYVIEEFSADIIDIDYRIRGMTRDLQGNKCFSDHEIVSISNYLAQGTLNIYLKQESVIASNNLFHCKLARKCIDMKEQIFNSINANFSEIELTAIKAKVQLQLDELFTQTTC
jgi:S-adenosylmethionine decarboxylase